MTDRILVVDDSKELRTLLSAQLRKQGFDVELAVDGLEGVEKASQMPPSLIIMDIMMPRMDGFEACRALRRNTPTKDIPIILLSALGGEEDIIRGIDAGADDYLVKPFKAPELSAKIKMLLRNRGGGYGGRTRDEDDTVEVRIHDTDWVRRFKETGQIVSRDFAGFQIVDKLGQGGTGTVYRAIEPVNLTPVALKVISPFVSQAAGFLDRFNRSGRIAIGLRHPHIARVYAIGESQGIHYITQELMEGMALDKVLHRERKLPVSVALKFMEEIADALVYLESQGMIHRDIKPGNVFVVEGDEGESSAKLADFGLARSVTDLERTIEGHILGTPTYIAPEQGVGEKQLDSRCDLYSLAATVFHLVTGEPPYRGDTIQELVLAHVNGQIPDAQAVNPEVPGALAAMLRRFMAKKPSDRASSMAEALELIRTVRAAISAATATGLLVK